MSFAIMTAAAPFIAIDLLGGSEKDSVALMGPLIGAAIPFFFFVPKVQMKYGWLRCMLWASIALAIVIPLKPLNKISYSFFNRMNTGDLPPYY